MKNLSELFSPKGVEQGSGYVVISPGMRGVSALAVLCLLFILSCLLFTSCAARKVEVPILEGVDPREVLAERSSIRSLESTLDIEFEKDGSVMRGDGVFRLTADSLDLQVYTLGFLVAEVTSNNSVTRSNPPIDKNKLFILVDGLRNSFFWWSIKNPVVRNDHDAYLVSNSWRRLFLNKRTMMPEKQIIDLEGGRQLTAYYDEPAFMDGVWFPSKMRLELSGQSVSLTIKTLSFDPQQRNN